MDLFHPERIRVNATLPLPVSGARIPGLNVSRTRLRIADICETNQLASKAFGCLRTGTVSTCSLS
jgi:hypothetical protein